MIAGMTVTSVRRRARGARPATFAAVAVLLAAACGATPSTPSATADGSARVSGDPTSGASAVPASAPASSAVISSPGDAPGTVSSASPSSGGPSASTSGGPSNPGTTDPAAARSAALQAAITRFAGKAGIPGLSVAIRWADGATWTGTYGEAIVASHRPVTPDTAFSAASISKTFTAALILQLVGEGRIGLDDPAVTYLGGRPLDRRITVRMLLDHTSGLADAFLAKGIDHALQAAPSAIWTPARTLAYVRKPYFAPGKGWHYSNTNYVLLGLVAEHVTGRPLATELRRRFLDPLGLADTWVQDGESPRTSAADGYVVTGKGSTLRDRDLADGTGVMPFRSVVTALGGAGGVAATPSDLAAWGDALYGGRVLSPSLVGLMTSHLHRTHAYVDGARYGLGVQELRIGPWLTLGHSGKVLGFRAQLRTVPAAGLTIAIMSNQSRTDLLPLVGKLLAIALPTPASAAPPVTGSAGGSAAPASGASASSSPAP